MSKVESAPKGEKGELPPLLGTATKTFEETVDWALKTLSEVDKKRSPSGFKVLYIVVGVVVALLILWWLVSLYRRSSDDDDDGEEEGEAEGEGEVAP